MNVEAMIPPEELVYTGRCDFLAIGDSFLEFFKEHCGLEPHHRLLDVGSGLGRMTIPLTQYLNDQGSYEGIEIVDVGVRWCQEKITPHYPNFRFQWADVYNQGYNPDGKHYPDQYVFPFANNSFDFVFLTSVFTHMMRADCQNYLYEIARVLKPGGCCLATYFLHDVETARLIANGKSVYPFQPWGRHCYIANPELPEDVIGFDQDYVERLYRKLGFHVENVFLGDWSGRAHPVRHQDMVVARKVRGAGLIGAARQSATRLMNGAKRRLQRIGNSGAPVGHGLITEVVKEARRSDQRVAVTAASELSCSIGKKHHSAASHPDNAEALGRVTVGS